MADVTIKLVKGLAGKKKDQVAVCESLGLRKTGDITVQPDNAARSNIWLRLLNENRRCNPT